MLVLSSHMDCFRRIFTEQLASNLVSWTNESLGSSAAPIKLWEVYAFVDTLLAISLFTLPTINSFWKQSPNGFIPAMNYGCKTV